MSKVLTFSTVFPKGHPSHGERTRFVEFIWAGLLPIYGWEVMHSYLDEHDGYLWEIKFIEWLSLKDVTPKVHTIRGGNRWTSGDVFSPRVWLGRPYHSQQVQFAPEMKVVEAQTLSISKDKKIFVGGKDLTFRANELSLNDGLLPDEFWSWFKKPFDGQLIMWAKNPYL